MNFSFPYSELLTQKNFRLLSLARLLNKSAFTLFQLEIIWFTMEITNQSPLYLSTIIMAGTVPFILFGMYGGHVADTYNKKKTMIYSDILTTLLIGLIPILFYFDSLTYVSLVIIYTLISTCSCFLEPSFRAILPDLIHSTQLQKGNALLDSIQRGVGIVIPPAIGIILFFTIPIHIFTICFFLFSLSTLCHLAIHYTKPATQPVHTVRNKQSIKATFTYIKSSKIILLIIVMQGVTIFINTGLWRVGLPLYLEKNVHEGLTTYGIITGLLAIAALTTSLLLGFIQRIQPITIFLIGILLWGSGLLFIGLSPTLFTIYVATILIGIGQASEGVSRLIIFQKEVPSTLLGKVFSTSSSINYASDTCSLAVISSVLLVLATSNVFILSGLCIGLSSIFGAIYVRKPKNTALFK